MFFIALLLREFLPLPRFSCGGWWAPFSRGLVFFMLGDSIGSFYADGLLLWGLVGSLYIQTYFCSFPRGCNVAFSSASG